MNKLTKDLEDSEISKLADLMKLQKFKNDDKIIKYGELAKNFYIISKGKVNVLVHTDGALSDDPMISQKVQNTKVLERGEGFGEVGLIFGERRSATVVAVEECEVYGVDANAFR
jgi:cGMP-dependent protein kinase 1